MAMKTIATTWVQEPDNPHPFRRQDGDWVCDVKRQLQVSGGTLREGQPGEEALAAAGAGGCWPPDKGQGLSGLLLRGSDRGRGNIESQALVRTRRAQHRRRKLSGCSLRVL